jgi:hypothetical protein
MRFNPYLANKGKQSLREYSPREQRDASCRVIDDPEWATGEKGCESRAVGTNGTCSDEGSCRRVLLAGPQTLFCCDRALTMYLNTHEIRLDVMDVDYTDLDIVSYRSKELSREEVENIPVLLKYSWLINQFRYMKGSVKPILGLESRELSESILNAYLSST